MNHRLAQIFRTGLATCMADGDFMRGPVVFHYEWMVHRDIRRALFEVTYRVTAGRHYVTEKLIGLRDRFIGIVDKFGLNRAPGCDIALPVAGREWTNGKSLDAFFSLFEPGFRLPSASAFFDCAGVFRPESSLQSFGFLFPKKHHR